MNNNTETIEQKAEQSFKAHHIGQQDLAKDVYEDGFKAGANEMLPIIKELGEALKELDFIYGNKDAYTKDTIGYKAAERIRTTLDKYQNYL